MLWETNDTRAVMNQAVVVPLCQIHEFSQTLHEEYVKTLLEKGSTTLGHNQEKQQTHLRQPS